MVFAHSTACRITLDLRALIGAFYIVLLLRAARPSIDLKDKAYWIPFNGVGLDRIFWAFIFC